MCHYVMLFLSVLPHMAAPPIEVPLNQRQLFLDDHVIESMENVARTLHQPVKHPDNPVLRREHPWEGFRVQVYGTVLYDPELDMFKAWYMNIPATAAQKIVVNGERRPGHATLLSYATSKDGVHWHKPVLNLVDFEGSTRNNMIAPDLYNPEGFSVLYEPHDPNPERKYKAFYWDHGRGPTIMHEGQEIYGVGKEDGMHVAFSPDGVHWTPYKDNPVMDVGSDSGQVVLFDPRIEKYVAFSRLGFGRRVARAESRDFVRWTRPELVLQADAHDPPNTEIYGISVDLYEGMYIGVLWMFYIEEGRVGPIDFQLAWSRDGKAWTRDPERRVFLGRGDENAWDFGDMRGACRSVILEDKIYLYYAGSNAIHGRGAEENKGMDIGLAILRRDGWMSIDGGDVPGVLITKPFLHPGGTLHINADAANGHITVQYLAEEVPGPISVSGNHTSVPVAFPRQTPSDLAGKLVRLRFTIQKASLYSFWFAE